MNQLGHLMGWDQKQCKALSAQFVRGWGLARQEKQQHKCQDRDAWCTVVLREQMLALKAMLQIALVFLLTETECERSFAQERIQFSGGRGRLDPHTRESGLKVMIDGLDLNQLQSVTHFWTSSCQNRYAEVWGS